MRVECPYCGLEVDVAGLATHVESEEGGGHGPQDTLPVENVDSPWNLRLDISSEDAPETTDEGVPSAQVVEESLRGGRCPNCKRGVVGTERRRGLSLAGPQTSSLPELRMGEPRMDRSRSVSHGFTCKSNDRNEE